MLSLEKNVNKHKTILLTTGVLLLSILMTSCGITDKTENQNIVHFFFGLIDKDQSETFFLVSTVAAAIYWTVYFINKREYRESRMYEECENDPRKGYEYFLLEKGNLRWGGTNTGGAGSQILGGFMSLCYGFPYLCPALAVLLFYSWIIHSRGVLYWIVCVATYIVLFPKSQKSRALWVKVWSVVSAVGWIVVAAL